MQRADQGQFGESYKVAPLSNYQVQNQMSCFKVDGAKGMEVTIQAILPDLKDFKVMLIFYKTITIWEHYVFEFVDFDCFVGTF